MKVGHFEINYGDAHFRRTDNGNAMYNPFVGNLIMDAFTTEIGGRGLRPRRDGFAGDGRRDGRRGARATITNPDAARLRLHRQGSASTGRSSPDLRVRLTGSAYTPDKSAEPDAVRRRPRRLALLLRAGEHGGDTERAGVVGRVQPGVQQQGARAFQVNPFVKFRGLELFGVIEQREGQRRQDGDEHAHGGPVRGRRGRTASSRREAVRRRPLQHGQRRSSPGSRTDTT